MGVIGKKDVKKKNKNYTVYRLYPTTAFQNRLLKILTISPKLQPHWTYHACFYHKGLLTIPFLWNKCLQMKLLDNMACWSFLRNCQNIFQSACTILYFHQQHMRFCFFSSAIIWYFHYFLFWPQVCTDNYLGLKLHFPNDDTEHLSLCHVCMP